MVIVGCMFLVCLRLLVGKSFLGLGGEEFYVIWIEMCW